MSKYFVITTTEDGDVYLQELEKEMLLNEMTPVDGHAELEAANIRTTIERGFENLTDRGGTFIIKGELVVPTPIEVVKTFEID